MTIREEYTSLITSQHINKGNFVATVTNSIDPLVKMQNVLFGLPEDFDIDTATGVQLDTLGIWIGRSRRIDIPLVGVYFSWDDTDATGWDSGIWKGDNDPGSGLVDLPDDAYRLLLKAKIAANAWDGTVPSAYEIWATIFPNTNLVIQDNQDMSMIVGIAGQQLSAVDKALLLNGYIPLKPEGVRIQFYGIAPNEGKIFAWDIESEALGGWEEGQWAVEIVPT